MPKTQPAEPREAARNAASVLLADGIIESFHGKDPEISPGHFAYGSGENCEKPFIEIESWCFQDCYLFGSNRPDIVPQFEGVDPSCPQCDTNVSDAYYLFVNDGCVEEMFRCPTCGHTCRVDGLVDEVGIFVTKYYVSFVDTDGAQVDPSWLETFSERIGVEFVVKEYWFT